MVDFRDYRDRLVWAMGEAKISTTQLAEDMGLSYQAVKKVVDGKSKAFSAANNEKAAAILGITSRWLATGEGPAVDRSYRNEISFSISEPPPPPTAREPLASFEDDTSVHDEWISEAVRTLQGLSKEDRRAAVLNLRVFVDKLDRPNDGQALPVAA